MRIAALSDFHIAALCWADPFEHDEKSFLRFLDRLEAGHDRIVLLGDIYQTDHGILRTEGSALRQLRMARRRLPELTARFSKPGYHYVCGNHDEQVCAHVGAVDSLRLEEDGYAILFIHGHQFDPILNNALRTAHLSTWTAGRLRFAGLRLVAQWLEFLDVHLKDLKFTGADDPYLEAARGLMVQRRANAVIMGHTHVPGRFVMPEGILVNTGTCSRGRTMYASIDTARRSITLHGA